MKKVILAIGLASLVASAISAFDFGGTLSNKSTGEYAIQYAPFEYSQKSSVDLWLNLYFGTNAVFNLTGSVGFALDGIAGGYTGEDGTAHDPSAGATTLKYDVDSFQFFLSLPEAFGPGTRENLWIGRSIFRDFSGEVLSHKLDGVVSELTSGSLIWRLGIGTSAVLFKDSSGIIVSNADRQDRANADIILAPPRLIGITEVDFSKLFLEQTLRLAVVADVDLRTGLNQAGESYDTSGTQPGGAVHQFFTGAKIDGKITGPLYWDIFGYLQVGSALSSATGTYQNTLILAGLGGIDFNLFLKEAANTTIVLSALIGTGDSDSVADFPDENATDNYTGFHGISKRSAGLIFAPQINNLFQGRLGFSLKPLANLGLALDNFIFMRPNLSSMGEQKLISNTSEQYIGFESDLALKWRISTELGTSFTVGAFIPNGLAIDRQPDFKAQWELTLSF